MRAYYDDAVGRGGVVEGKVDEDAVGILGRGGGGSQDDIRLMIPEGLLIVRSAIDIAALLLVG